jgi:hypothetical protein
MLISAGKRQIVGISKTCAGMHTFLQPVPETDRPDRQTGLGKGQDSGKNNDVPGSGD